MTGSPQSAQFRRRAGSSGAVTDQVKAQYTTNNGFRISDAVESESNTAQTQTYDSREAANDPQLLITFQ